MVSTNAAHACINMKHCKYRSGNFVYINCRVGFFLFFFLACVQHENEMRKKIRQFIKNVNYVEVSDTSMSVNGLIIWLRFCIDIGVKINRLLFMMYACACASVYATSIFYRLASKF